MFGYIKDLFETENEKKGGDTSPAIKTVAISGGLTVYQVAIPFKSFIIVFMGWPCQSDRGKGFQTDSCLNYPHPPTKYT